MFRIRFWVEGEDFDFGVGSGLGSTLDSGLGLDHGLKMKV